MPTYAQIDADGVCVGVSHLSGVVVAPHMIPIANDASPVGRRWTGADWEDVLSDTQPTIPQRVQMRQARLALFSAGLLDAIDPTIEALPEPDRAVARIEWEYSPDVKRHNGLVDKLAPSLGLTDEQVDALFIQAAQM